MKWIHRDDHKPADGQHIVISGYDRDIYEGSYDLQEDEVYVLDGYVKWVGVLAWMPKEDFIFPKEEDFE